MRAVWLGLLLCAGCADAGPVAGLVPELPSDASLLAVLLLDEAGRIVESTGLIEPSRAHQIELESPSSDIAEILVVAYDDLVLSPARRPSAETLARSHLRLAGEDEGRLPRPSFVAAGPFESETQLEAASSAPALTASWVEPCARTACQRFRFSPLKSIPVPGEAEGFLRTAVTSADRKEVALAGTSTPTFVYRFWEPDRAEPVAGPLPGARPRALSRRADGRLVLLEEDGKLWMEGPEGQWGLEIETTNPIEMTNLSVAGAGGQGEVYAQDENANVYLLESNRWRLVANLGATRSANQWVEWLGPSELLVLADEGDRVIQLRDEVVVSEQSFHRGRVVLPVEGLGTLVSGGQALSLFEPGVYVWTPESMTPVPIPPTARSPEGLWRGPRAGEFFYGGANGELHFYADGLGGCQMPAWSGEAIRSVAALSEGVLLAARPSSSAQGEARLLYVPFAEPPRLACEDVYR